MRTHIEGNIYIGGDKLGFTIMEKKLQNVRDKKTKEITGTEEVFDIVGNYATLAGAVKGLLHLKIADSKAESFEELLQEVKAHRAFIESKIDI